MMSKTFISQPLQTPGVLPSSCYLDPFAALSSSRRVMRKKRSRRAPTTVLTTDTSNFRAMVQQFYMYILTPSRSNFELKFGMDKVDLMRNIPKKFHQNIPPGTHARTRTRTRTRTRAHTHTHKIPVRNFLTG
ncbi:unnamed protein product, partial [Cuscuta epithymum]